MHDSPFGNAYAPATGRHDPDLMLDAVQRLGLERLVPALDRALGKADDYLFDGSQAGNEQVGLTALRDLRRSRASILQRFEQGLHGAFRELRSARRATESSGTPTLSLVEEDALEEQLANEQLAESLTRMHAPALELLERRIAYLLDREVLGEAGNPLAPRGIADRMQLALGNLDLPAPVRIVVFKCFERELAATLGALYERANTLLAAAGVLPDLRASARAIAEAHTATRTSTLDALTPQPQPAQGSVSPTDQALFANLIGLLQSWRGTAGTQLPGHAQSGPGLRTSELMTVLSLMQRDMPAQLADAMEDESTSLADALRGALVGGASRLGISKDDARLDGLDEDAVDLVAMLFDVLLDGRHFDPGMRGKIGRMLVPYVKVALKDRRLFLFKEHPARRLLNTVAEACEGNHGDAPQERELLDRVDRTIDRLVAEFNEDTAIFESLEQELRGFVAQYRKRVELVEKRAADAQRGRERLDHARESAARELSALRGDRRLPPLLDQLLETHAPHHLTQVILRDGQGSVKHDATRQAIERLLLIHDQACAHTPRELMLGFPSEEVAAMLASSGMDEAAAAQATSRLKEALLAQAAGDEAPLLQSRLPERERQPEPVSPPEPALQVVTRGEGLDFDADVLARVRELQVGQWLHLDSGHGLEPAKVSWVSPISARLLLVNRRGIRVLVASLEELAALAKAGKLALREADNAFEDALHQVAGRLRSASQR